MISTASTMAMLGLGPELRERITLAQWFAAIVQAHDTLCVLLPWLLEHVTDWDWRAIELDARAYLAQLHDETPET